MLTSPKLKIIQELIANSSREELIWLNGYLAGIVAQTDKEENEISAPTQKPAVGKITIAYGTETGNSKKLATDFASRAKKNGINAKLVSLDQYRLNDLPKEEFLFAVVSTQGDGEPPAAAKKFYDHIHQNGFKLEKLKFGVLALGDTAYPLFCKAGEDIDAQLQKLGGQRVVSLKRCDTDYESEAGNWFSEVLQKLSGDQRQVSASPVVVTKKAHGKKVYQGKILTNINLNDRGSKKQTHHIEIEAEGLDYQPGDSIGIVPENATPIVESIIALTGIDRNKNLLYRSEEYGVYDLLKKKLNIAYLPERVVKKYAALIQQEIPETKIGLFDLLKIYPVRDAGQFEDVLELMEPIAPRLYSISSSPEAHSGEVHITVARDTFTINEEVKFGLCSDVLCQLPPDHSFEFYVHKNAQFKLPPPDKDIIMIGPGTGIAPFRSFLEERDATGASGRNWLFFGDQHFYSDFLYQTEFQDWIKTGVLTKMNTAFSRDQAHKVYVQHKMISHGEEFFNWLQSGAYLYVCGAKDPMSTDVENAILQIAMQFGQKTESEATGFLEKLKEEGRYLKDVY
ncbi:MAG: sulfite reductase [Bacteroidetes bacterium]|nr:MAG: sulfite reductase [Bacteroidota bacterium]